MAKQAENHGVNEEAMKAPITPAILGEAREALSLATSLLLSPYSEKNEMGGRPGDKAFYANFLMRMRVEFTNRLATAGVNITDRINLFVNPHFLLSLSIEERMELLIHEVEHIVYLHPIRGKQLIENSSNKQNDHQLYNVSADANINIPLTALTERLGVTIERLNKQLAEKGSKTRLSEKDASDVHFWKLKEFQEEFGEQLEKQFGSGGEVDDHSIWEESEGNEELAEAMVKDAANKAAEATGAGNMPQHMARQINTLNKSLVNWKRELQQFAVRTLKYEHEATRSKRNRRFGIIQQGKRKKPLLHLVVIGDESGSMSDENVQQVFSEIDKIHSYGIRVTYIAMDTQVSSVVEYKKGMKMNRTACGGTYYSSGIDKAKELKPDAILVLGDMDSADTPKDPKTPLMWVVFGSQKPPASFGKAIYITDQR